MEEFQISFERHYDCAIRGVNNFCDQNILGLAIWAWTLAKESSLNASAMGLMRSGFQRLCHSRCDEPRQGWHEVTWVRQGSNKTDVERGKMPFNSWIGISLSAVGSCSVPCRGMRK